MLDTSKSASHDSAKRKQQFLERIRHCKHIDREYKVAEIIFSNLNSRSGFAIAWPSEQTLATTTGQNIRTIKQHVACLQALGVIEIRRMGGVEFRDWAEREYGLGSEYTRASTRSRHLMNIYLPCWDGSLARTGQPTEEQVEGFLTLKSKRRQGKASDGRMVAPVPPFSTGIEQVRIVAQVPLLNGGTSGILNSGTGATQSGGSEKGPPAPFHKNLEESDLEITPSAAADQTEPPSLQGIGIGNQSKGAISPQPCQTLSPKAFRGNSGKVSPALPVNDQAGFKRFLNRWDHLASCLPSWKPMTAHALGKWITAWDSIEALREGIDQVLDAAAANPHMCGLKQGRVRFEMEPTYMLGFKDGNPIFALLAEGLPPYYDFKRPIHERVALLLNRHPTDAISFLQSSDDFYPHERSRAAELLAELVRERAEVAARKAERDARASLLAEEKADVAYRLATLEALPLIGGLDDLQEYITGLESCPSAEGKELIANSLFKQTRYYNQWYRMEGYAADLLSALAGVDGPGAERMRDNLISRFGTAETVVDEELALLLG